MVFNTVWNKILNNNAPLGITVLQSPTLIETTQYEAFGDTIKISDDELLHVCRSGISHNNDKGKLIGRKYNIANDTWGQPYDIYEHSTDNVVDPGLRIINGKIYIFTGLRGASLGDSTDFNYLVSTDLTGTSWTGPFSFSSSLDLNDWDKFFFHASCATPTSVSGTYLVAYNLINATEYAIRLQRTTDNGVTFNDYVSVYQGVEQWTEACMTYIGNQKLIMILRDNGGGYLGWTKSDDDGATWTAPVHTAIFGDASSVKPPFIFYDEERDGLLVAYLSREATPKLYLSFHRDPDSAFSDINTFEAPLAIETGGYDNDRNGYPSVVRLNSGKLLLISSRQISSSVAKNSYTLFNYR